MLKNYCGMRRELQNHDLMERGIRTLRYKTRDLRQDCQARLCLKPHPLNLLRRVE